VVFSNEGVNAFRFEDRFSHGIDLHQNRLPEPLCFY
jgi:hypothetical protein